MFEDCSEFYCIKSSSIYWLNVVLTLCISSSHAAGTSFNGYSRHNFSRFESAIV
jgi:hypothetical protein